MVDISLVQLFFFAAFLLVPCAVFWHWKLFDVTRDTVISVVRMMVQLLLVGLYLKYIFDLNSVWLNLAWLLVMVTVANISVLRRAGLAVSRLFMVTQLSLMLSIGLVCGLFLAVLVQPDPFFDARYLIPVTGMLLGNCLQGNIRALDVFFNDLKANEAAYLSDLLLGATVGEATEPVFKKAFRSAMTPMLGSIATLGIVSLPGMMTGQILGGALPLTAAKYQIAIMIGIFLAMSFAIAINLRLSLRVAFTPYGLLDKSIFARTSH